MMNSGNFSGRFSSNEPPYKEVRRRSDGYKAVKRAAYLYALWRRAEPTSPWRPGTYVRDLMLAESLAGLLCACAVYRFARRERLWPGMGADGWEHVMGRWI